MLGIGTAGLFLHARRYKVGRRIALPPLLLPSLWVLMLMLHCNMVLPFHFQKAYMCHSLVLCICTIVPNHKDVQYQTNKCKIKEAKTKNTHSQSIQALHSLLLFICTMHNLILFKCTVHNHSKPHQTKSRLSI